MKLPALPKRLYKYRAFNINTLRLLTEAQVYYARPDAFNDPLDCSPTIQVDVDRATLERLCFAMLLRFMDREKAKKEIGNHRYMTSEHGDYKTDAEADYLLRLAEHMCAVVATT